MNCPKRLLVTLSLGLFKGGDKAGDIFASGVAEGACRHLVKDRMERTGMRWRPPTAQAMLDTRCVYISGQWEAFNAYRRQLAEADTILSIHPSTDISGTVRSAETAKEDFPGADIRILDSRTVGGNLATCVQLAVAWAESGVSADDIMARLQALIPRGRIYFLVATLEYLQRGGRIGGATALIGSVLQIKPLLELREGRIEALEKVRTHHLALARLSELVRERCPRSPEAHLCVMHADDEREAQNLARGLQTSLGAEAIPIYHLGAAITTHAGPGALAVGFFQ